MAVVKANAYGHGAQRIAAVLEDEGIRFFMVATLAEALLLRSGTISSPILVASPPNLSNLPLYTDHNLHASITSPVVAEHIVQSNLAVKVHLKVDTGMGRLGVTPDEAQNIIPRLLDDKRIKLEGLWTHLATASHEDTSFALEQVQTARNLYTRFSPNIPLIHVGNSSALLQLAGEIERAPNALFRVGGALLGLSALPQKAETIGLQPILSLTSRVLQVKAVKKGTSISYGRTWTAPTKRWIATVGLGYADGIPSSLSSPFRVKIRDHQFPIVGRVCMDMIMLDIGEVTGTDCLVSENDRVTVFGPEYPLLNELAERSNRKAYEICCSISQRVPRIYFS